MKYTIIKALFAKNRNCFRYKDVLEEFPHKDHSYLSKILASMVDRGMLMKLSRDLYYIIPLNANPDSYTPDSRLIAKCLMTGEDYYIAYSSAMYIHGLTDQPGSRTMIATSRQKKPSIKSIKGAEFQYIFQIDKRFFGFKETWIGQQEQVMVSGFEKTIVDAVSKPQLCGGIVGVGKAIYRSNGDTDLDQLFFSLARNGSKAAMKRYLFINELLGMKWSSEHERMLNESRASFSLLDPAGPDLGRKNSRFGLKVNLDVHALKHSIRSL